MKFKVVVLWVLSIMLLLPGAIMAQDEAPYKPGDIIFVEGFEGFTDERIHPGWAAWCLESGSEPNKPPIRCPEYKQANENGDLDYRVHSGNNAQQYFTLYASHTTGVYRVISGLEPGTEIEATAWYMAWSSNNDDPFTSDDNEIHARVCVGQDAQTSFEKVDVCSEPGHTRDEWDTVSVKAVVGEDGAISLWLATAPKWPVKHNDMYWDDVDITIVSRPSMPVAEEPVYVPPPDPILEGIVGGSTAPGVTGGSNVVFMLLLVAALAALSWLSERTEQPI